MCIHIYIYIYIYIYILQRCARGGAHGACDFLALRGEVFSCDMYLLNMITITHSNYYNAFRNDVYTQTSTKTIIDNYSTLHHICSYNKYITLHYITLHYITLHYNTIHYNNYITCIVTYNCVSNAGGGAGPPGPSGLAADRGDRRQGRPLHSCHILPFQPIL